MVRKKIHLFQLLESSSLLKCWTRLLLHCSLGPLVSKVKEYQVETIVDTLCTNMLSDKEQLRDISSIGLKTVIGELPPASSGKSEKQSETQSQTDAHRNTQTAYTLTETDSARHVLYYRQ